MFKYTQEYDERERRLDMDYGKFLPNINVEEGKARIMNNMALYIKLLNKFKGRQMADNLIEAAKNGDHSAVAQHAHALRGTAANLSFPRLNDITSEIESLAKASEDSLHLTAQLDSVVTDLEAAIAELVNG